MELTLASDTTSLNYWLTWKFFLCVIWVFGSMIIASYLIWKYEGPGKKESYKEVTQEERAWFLYDGEAWMPCIKGLPPAWLLAFRITSFCLLLAAGVSDVAINGTDLFFYYTQFILNGSNPLFLLKWVKQAEIFQRYTFHPADAYDILKWTLSLVTFYFAFGSLLSVYGCFRHHKTCNVGKDQDFLLPLSHEENTTSQRAKSHFLLTAAFWSYVFEIIFQMSAGAAMLTDSVYWIVIVPFLTIVGYELGFLTLVAHSLNLVLLLGDTALNSLSFPWFRISYFLLLTAFYVLFEWILHALVSTWWPYPFLDLTVEYAPLWYLLVALLHIPCYSLFFLVVKLKYHLLARWFPQSYQSLK